MSLVARAEGLESDENLLKKRIYDRIKHHITTGLGKKVPNLLKVLRMECCAGTLPLYEDRIKNNISGNNQQKRGRKCGNHSR